MEQYCDKETFATRKEAQTLASERNKHGHHLNVYQCEVCRQFHLSTQKRNDVVKIKIEKIKPETIIGKYAKATHMHNKQARPDPFFISPSMYKPFANLKNIVSIV